MIFKQSRTNTKLCSALAVALVGTIQVFLSEPAWAGEIQTQATANTPAAANTPATANTPAAADTPAAAEAVPKLMLKPGQPVVVNMQTEDIAVTEDVNLAKEQVAAYPDSPEASFILAV